MPSPLRFLTALRESRRRGLTITARATVGRASAKATTAFRIVS